MRMLLPVVMMMFFVACLPQGPTGNAIAPPTHVVDGSEILVSVSSAETVFEDHTVKITVRGDRVYPRILVNGDEHTLSGTTVSGEWLSYSGSAVVFLPPGEHVVHAFSCLESFTGWDCGCVTEDDCGHWMERTVIVE